VRIKYFIALHSRNGIFSSQHFSRCPQGLAIAGKIALLTAVPRESWEDLIGQVYLENSGGRCEWLKAKETHLPPSF
jgi:hypothetical protein